MKILSNRKRIIISVIIALLSIFVLISSLQNFESKIDLLVSDGNFSGGNGTSEYPYIMTSKKDMDRFSSLVNNGNSNFTSKYYEVDTSEISNIELGNFVPIGQSNTLSFDGEFNGNGVNFNVKIDLVTTGVGIFGYAGVNSILKNFSVSGSIKGNSHVGSIVGISQGKILNVYSTATVYAIGKSGGLVGNGR